MSDSQQRNVGRIPQNPEQAQKLMGGRSYFDLAVFVIAPLALTSVLLLFQLISGLHFLIGLFVTITVNWILFRRIPDEESVTMWVRGAIHYFRLPRFTTKHQFHADGGVTAEDEYIWGEPAEDEPTRHDLAPHSWEKSQTTEDLVGVRQIHKEFPIIERDDGVFVGAIEVKGSNFTLTDRQGQQAVLQRYGKHLNSIEFDTITHITTDTFEMDEHTTAMESRLEDKDLTDRPILADAMKAYTQRMKTMSGEVGLNWHRTYEIVTVDPATDLAEVDDTPFDFIEPDSPVGRLLGLDEPNHGSEDRSRIRAGQEVLERLKSLQSGIGSIDAEFTARRLSNAELAALVSHRWRAGSVADAQWEPKDEPVMAPSQEHQTANVDDLLR